MKLFGITEHGKLQEIALLGREKTKPRETRLDHYLAFLLQADSSEEDTLYREIKVVIPYPEVQKSLLKEPRPNEWDLTILDVEVVSETLLENDEILLVVLRPSEAKCKGCWTLNFYS